MLQVILEEMVAQVYQHKCQVQEFIEQVAAVVPAVVKEMVNTVVVTEGQVQTITERRQLRIQVVAEAVQVQALLQGKPVVQAM